MMVYVQIIQKGSRMSSNKTEDPYLCYSKKEKKSYKRSLKQTVKPDIILAAAAATAACTSSNLIICL